MTTFRSFACSLAICFFLAAGLGCTRVVFKQPVGVTPAEVDLSKELVGDWTGEKGETWTVTADAQNHAFHATCIYEGKTKVCGFRVTTVGHDVFIIWAEDQDLPGFVPLRVAGADQALALLYPDDEFVKHMAESGKLPAEFLKDKNAWLVSEGDWTAFLESKDFWKLNVSLPFTRKLPAKNDSSGQSPSAGISK